MKNPLIIILVAAGAALSLLGMLQLRRSASVKNWLPVNARIVSHEIEMFTVPEYIMHVDGFVPVFQNEYVVEGDIYF